MFCYRFDVDTRLCAKEGVPNLLASLERHHATGSFYAVLGKEDFYPWVWFQQEFLARRCANPEAPRPRKSKITRSEFARRLLRRVVFAREQQGNLQKIIDYGHELGCHGMRHEEWALNLPRMNAEKEFDKMVATYRQLFDATPESFAAPTFRTEEKVLAALDSHGFKAAGDLRGSEPFRPIVAGRKFSCVQVPVNVMCEDTVPLTEHFWKMGCSQQTIARQVCKRIDALERKGLPAVVYGHPLLEGRALLPAVEMILAHCRKKKYENATCLELAKRYRNNFKLVDFKKVSSKERDAM